MQPNDAPAGPDERGEGGPPPWINPSIQQQITWRDGDIVVSVPIKSGTTWTMNIVHQLREGGDPNLDDVYAEVPWIEFVPGPKAEIGDIVAGIDGMPSHRRRAFKTHSPPSLLPYQEPGQGKDVKYLVVVRNPDEALVSMHPFIAMHNDAWFELWGMPKEAVHRPDFETFYREVVVEKGFQDMLFGFVASWWPFRDRPNVLFLHYADMKRDHEGSIRKIADFLGFEPSEAEWPAILEYTSFPWMKAHQDKFEVGTIAQVPVLKSGAMVRRGQVGAAKEDGMSEGIAAAIRERGQQMIEDAAALQWLYEGGPLAR
jgi:aryl sulfotransferase